MQNASTKYTQCLLETNRSHSIYTKAMDFSMRMQIKSHQTNSEIRCRADIGETLDNMTSRSGRRLAAFHGRGAMKTPQRAWV